jgi:hypothetical protein
MYPVVNLAAINYVCYFTCVPIFKTMKYYEYDILKQTELEMSVNIFPVYEQFDYSTWLCFYENKCIIRLRKHSPTHVAVMLQLM